jgi:hypothetical protein
MVDKTIYTGTKTSGLTNLSTTFTAQTSFCGTSVATAFGTWSDSTGTYTSSDAADAIFFTFRIEATETVANESAILGKVVNKGGTAPTAMHSPLCGGIMETNDTTEDTCWIVVWAIAVGPATDSTFELQLRDAGGSPTGNFTTTSLEIFPINYGAIGLYSSTSTTAYSGTTPNQIGSFSADYQSDTAQIQINGTDAVDLKGDNKRYLVLGNSAWYDGWSTDVSQRVIKIYADGTPYSMGYFPWRSGAADAVGCTTSTILETVTATVDLDLRMYGGDGAGARQGGTANTGVSPTNALHTLAVIELKDGCEVFRSHDPTGLQECALLGPVDIQVCDTVDLNDTASWTKSAATTMNAEVAMDCFIGANIAIPKNAVGFLGWSAYAELTVNGTEKTRSRAGNYQGHNGTSIHGYVASLLGIETLALNDDLGISITEYTGSEGGNGDVETEDFASDEGITFWGINLDTMNNEATSDAPVLIHNMKQQV